jgi:hypothetical protein
MFEMIKKYTHLLIVPVFLDVASGLKLWGQAFLRLALPDV